MPRTFGLSALAGALAAFALTGAAGAQDADCPRELTLGAARDGLIDLRVFAPCHPYARVDIAYGPFVLTEETAQDGRVDLRLPRIATLPEAAAQIDGSVLFAALPAVRGPQPVYVALLWRGEVDLALRLAAEIPGVQSLTLGFPIGPEAHRAHILAFPPGAVLPEAVDLTYAGRPCHEGPVAAALLSSSSETRVPIRLPAPGCDGAESVLRLPLTRFLGAPETATP